MIIKLNLTVKIQKKNCVDKIKKFINPKKEYMENIEKIEKKNYIKYSQCLKAKKKKK